jgi:hypothetical protein
MPGGLAAVVAVPIVVVLAGAHGLPSTRMGLSGGGAWLASPAQGLVTLMDGPSEQVVGSVRAPAVRAGDDLSVVQAGSSAYVVNSSLGTVSRVDGGTYAVSAPVQFGTRGRSLGVLAGGPGLYVIDGARRVASVVDPVSLKVRERLSLVARPGPGQAVVDDAGQLWVLDADGGGLTWFAGGKRVRPEVGDAAARLVLVQGRPVLVDLARRRLGRLADNGTVPAWSCVDIRAGDEAHLLGSVVSPTLYAVVPATGTLVAAGLDSHDCGLAVDVGAPGDVFGQPVEAGRFVLVPNRSSGRTVVVDPAARRAVATLSVTRPGARLELVAKDGLVFYNDLDGDKAGIIRFDGQRWITGKALRKYNPSNSGDGILTPAGADKPDPAGDLSGNGRKPDQPRHDKPDPDNRDPAGQNPDQQDPGQQNPGGQNPGGQDPGGQDPGGQDPGGPPPPSQPPVIRGINISPDVVVRGQEATFTADVINAPNGSWHWSIVDPANGATLQQATTPRTMTATLPVETTPNALQVRLDVTNSAGTASRTLGFTTTSNTKPQIDSLTATPDNAGIGQQVAFHAVEDAAGSRGSWNWSIAGPGGPYPDVQTDPGKDLTQTLTAAGDYTVTLTVTFDRATDQRQTHVNVADRAQLSQVTSTPADMRDGTGSIRIGLDTAFVPQHVTVTTANWLTLTPAPSAGGITLQPGTEAGFTLTGTPPTEGQIDGAVTFRLDNGNTVSYAVLTNLPPDLTGPNCDTSQDSVTFHGHHHDDFATLSLVVGSDTYPMQFAGQDLYFKVVSRANLPNVSTWTVVATDGFGLTSRIDVARGQCW